MSQISQQQLDFKIPVPPVRLLRSGNLLFISPPQPWLQEKLHFWERIFPRGKALVEWKNEQRLQNKQPKDFKLELRSMYAEGTYQNVPVGVCMIGFIYRVRKLLDEYKIPYELGEAVPREPIQEPNYANMGELRGNQDEGVAAVLTYDYGILDGPTGWGKSYAIRQLCLLLDKTKILIVVPQQRGIAIAKTIWNMLRDGGIQAELAIGGNKMTSRVTIANTSSILAFSDAYLDSVRLTLYDEVYTAAAPKTVQALNRIRFSKMIGLADGPFSRTDGRNMITEGFFGKVIHTTQYDEAVRMGMISQITVLKVPISKDAATSRTYSTDIGRKRNYIWRNGVRNAGIAQSLHLAAQKLNSTVENLQYLILVETLDHALHLHKYLPFFKVCHAGGIDKERTDDLMALGFKPDDFELDAKQLGEYQRQFEAGTLRHVICTPIWSTGVNFLHLDVEVRADASVGDIRNIQWPGRLSRLGKEKILIDFDDQFNENMAKRSEKRFAFYAKRKWKIEEYSQPLPAY